MRIATLIALQTGALVASGLGLAGIVASAQSRAMESRSTSSRYRIERERFERVSELTSQLVLVGDLVLSGGTTYLIEVAHRAAALARSSIETSMSDDFLVRSTVDERALVDLIDSLERTVTAASEATDEEREAGLARALAEFDDLAFSLEIAIEDAQVTMDTTVDRAATRADEHAEAALRVTVATIAAFVLLTLLLWSYLRRTIERPIRRLTGAAAEADQTGVFEVEPAGPVEVRRLTRGFDGLICGLQQALETRASFVANTSHELRTPLNAILGYAEFLNDGQPTEEELREGLTSIHRSGSHLLGLINDVLDFSKIDADQMAIEEIPVPIGEVLEQVRAILEGGAVDKGIELSVEASGSTPPWITTDPVRLRQMILNVAGNAIKFTEVGGVRVELAWSKGVLEIEVHDTGTGIPEDRLDRIFEDFQQADDSSTRTHGGTGLGLAISRRLARMMGGDIRARSRVGEGSTFTITLDAPATDAPTEASAPGSSAVPEEGRPLRVLLADDVEVNRRLGVRILERAGHAVVEAVDGVEALEAASASLRGAAPPLDAILMDLQMPRMSGLEATVEIRALGYSGPVIALTAAALSEERNRAQQAGCSGFITKPFSAHTLLDTLATAAAGERRGAA